MDYKERLDTKGRKIYVNDNLRDPEGKQYEEVESKKQARITFFGIVPVFTYASISKFILRHFNTKCLHHLKKYIIGFF